VHPEEAGVQEQVIQRDLFQAAQRPGLILALDGYSPLMAWQTEETVDLEIAA